MTKIRGMWQSVCLVVGMLRPSTIGEAAVCPLSHCSVLPVEFRQKKLKPTMSDLERLCESKNAVSPASEDECSTTTPVSASLGRASEVSLVPSDT